MRIDKYLWCVRVFKTRSLATQAVKAGKVRVSEELVKPSRELKIGETAHVRKGAITYSYKVTAFPKSRVGAKLVPDYMENVTSPEELENEKMLRIRMMQDRAKGTGRPTKKDRREMDDFTSGWDWNEWDED